MPGGAELADELRAGEKGGMPWFAIFSADGTRQVTSVGPDGNVGCPVTEPEAAWFFEMLARTRKQLTDEDLAVLRREHDAFATPIRQR